MSFQWPMALWGLLLIPVTVAAYVLLQRRRMRYAVRFTNLDLLANVVDQSPRWRRHVPPTLFLLALAALLLGVARPQATMKTPQEQASVVLAMDVSTSMKATDVDPTRLVAARRAAQTFLDRVPGKLRVGLVSFSNGANVLVPPTDDHALVRSALDTLRANGGTAIGDAIAVSARLRPQSGSAELASVGNGPKTPLVVLLLSDGEPSPGTLDPIQASQTASTEGVKVFTVALGTDAGTVTVPDGFGGQQTVNVPPDRQTLSRIAEITGGRFFAAPSEQALESAYKELGSEVGYTMKKQDVTFAFAGAGALLLLAGGMLSVLWFNRLP